MEGGGERRKLLTGKSAPGTHARAAPGAAGFRAEGENHAP